MTLVPDEVDTSSETRFRRATEGVIGVPATEGNRIEVLRNGDEIFPSMLDAIADAHHTIDFLTFVYWKGEIGRTFAHALATAADRGVRVRVLLDSWGARTIEPALVDLLEGAGVDVRWFRPLGRLPIGQMNHRTHRKVLIVDEAMGFTGGVGIADQWTGDAQDEDHWRDTHFRIAGPAVDGLRAAFLDNWSETSPELFDESVDRFPHHRPGPGSAVVQCVRGASETGNSDIYTLFRTLIQLARGADPHRDRILRPRRRDRRPARTTLRVEASRWSCSSPVRTPTSDSCSSRARRRSRRCSTRASACGRISRPCCTRRVMTVDGVVSNIGSANFNARSTRLDEEINVVAIDRDLTSVLDRQFDDDLASSRRVDPGAWRRRSPVERAVGLALSPFRRVF